MQFTDDITILDRSDLQDWAECPLRAKLKIEHGINSAGDIAAVGNECHDAIARFVEQYVDFSEQGAVLPRHEWAARLSEEIMQARDADVHAEAVSAIKWSISPLARFISEIHPNNILRFDGGVGERSGQLAWEYETLRNTRITSELDFLFATDSPEITASIDWKSGWKHWNPTAVRNSFQFRMHAALVFHNYPDIRRHRVAVWDIRRNERTEFVDFYRDSLPELDAHIMAAVKAYKMNRSSKNPEAWPTSDKCRICDAILFCDVADGDVKSVATDPGGWLKKYINLTKRQAAIKKALWGVVESTGEDIKTEDGECFGWDKPGSKSKPSNPVYQEASDDDGGDE